MYIYPKIWNGTGNGKERDKIVSFFSFFMHSKLGTGNLLLFYSTEFPLAHRAMRTVSVEKYDFVLFHFTTLFHVVAQNSHIYELENFSFPPIL